MRDLVDFRLRIKCRLLTQSKYKTVLPVRVNPRLVIFHFHCIEANKLITKSIRVTCFKCFSIWLI